MKLVTIDRPPSGRAGLLVGEEILDIGLAGSLVPLLRWAPTSLSEIIAAGDEALELLRRLLRKLQAASDQTQHDLRECGALVARSSVRLRAPIPRPGILLSNGRSYRSHVQEMKPGQTAPAEPIGFLKNVNAIVGCGEAIVLPAAAPAEVDFEAEISVVFARPCHGVTATDALDYVLGVTIVNDVSARDWVPDISRNPDLNRMGKQFATFAPMGPCITTLDEFDDIDDLHVVTRLNDVQMQRAGTRELIWSLRELIAYYSRWYPFRAGDILTTGTPEGVGYGRTPKVFMKDGDVIRISVEGVGELWNPIRRARAPTE